MEQITASQAFSPGRRVGIGQTYYFAKEQVRWFNGIFGAPNVYADKFVAKADSAKGIIYNSRLTFVPYYAQEGAKYFHFGGHYLYRENQRGDDDFEVSSVKVGGFSRAATWFSTTALSAPDYNQGGLEAAWGCGPLAISSELFAGTFGGGRDMYGGYVEARYFLTGDARLYDKKYGSQGGVKLKKNFLTMEDCIQTWHGPAKVFAFRSFGAWELVTQWSFTDSDRVARVNGNANGGRTTDLVVGLNWYWNPTTRWMFEYVHSDGAKYNDFRATEDIFAVSFRFNF
jgi:phosphate-selective porin OprO/OprP